eukprot:GHRR01024244.1.p1 GENE.GHRR01024244.1~~GHRR01024244.1.p1  ORF type:complete len:145 (+),score=30.78 GHRR01024244.1:1029-1463(+)
MSRRVSSTREFCQSVTQSYLSYKLASQMQQHTGSCVARTRWPVFREVVPSTIPISAAGSNQFDLVAPELGLAGACTEGWHAEGPATGSTEILLPSGALVNGYVQRQSLPNRVTPTATIAAAIVRVFSSGDSTQQSQQQQKPARK